MDQSRMIAILAQQVGILSSEIKSLSSSPGGRLSKEDEGLEVDSLEGYTIEMMPEDASSTTTDEDDSSSSSPRHLEQIPLANMFKKHKFTASPTRQFNRSHSLQQFDDVGSSGDLSESVKPRKKSAGNETNKLLQVPKC